MNAPLTTRRTSLDASANALLRRRHSLDAEINDEMKQSVPCHLQLGQLKRSKQRVKDENAEIEGVPITVPPAWVERRKIKREKIAVDHEALASRSTSH